jgi:hypothetical protein
MALTQTQVSQLYISILGRASEGNGSAFWVNASDMNTAAASMLDSAGAKAYFGTSIDSNAAFIQHIYVSTLGKVAGADAEGEAFWTAALDRGMTRAEIVVSMIDAVTGTVNAGKPAQNTFNNKVDVSNYVAENIAESSPADNNADLTGYISSVTDAAASVITVKATVDADADAPASTLVTVAADAAYAELIIAADATAGEIATAAALTLTTAEAAIAAGATQAEITAAYDVLVEAGADEIAAAEAAAIKVQIVDLADANTAVNEYLATLDGNTDINTSDDDVSTTTVEATAYYNSTVSDYEALVKVSQSVVATDTAASAAAKLALQEDANTVVLTTANKAVTTATNAITAVTGLTATNAALVAAHAATAAAAAAAVVTESAVLGGDAAIENTLDAQTGVTAATATPATGVVEVTYGGDTLTLTKADVKTGIVSLVAVADETDVVTAAEITNFAALQALSADYIAAFNADLAADAAVVTALTAEGVANAAVQALDPHANNIALAGTVTTTAATLANAIVTADTGEGDTVNTDATISAGTIVVAADGGITATVAGVVNTVVATNVAGTITASALFDAPDVAVLALIAAVEAKEAADVALTAGQLDLTNVSPLGTALATAAAAVVAAELTISTLDDATDALADSTVINDALVALELVASDAATALVGEQELTDAAGITLGANTVAMLSNLVATDAATVADFNVDTDSIYFGDAYTVNTGALTTGDNSVLEMFITDKSATDDTAVLTFETAVYGTDTGSTARFTVELTGVATTDIAIVDGMILGA